MEQKLQARIVSTAFHPNVAISSVYNFVQIYIPTAKSLERSTDKKGFRNSHADGNFS